MSPSIEVWPKDQFTRVPPQVLLESELAAVTEASGLSTRTFRLHYQAGECCRQPAPLTGAEAFAARQCSRTQRGMR